MLAARNKITQRKEQERQTIYKYETKTMQSKQKNSLHKITNEKLQNKDGEQSKAKRGREIQEESQ